MAIPRWLLSHLLIKNGRWLIIRSLRLEYLSCWAARERTCKDKSQKVNASHSQGTADFHQEFKVKRKKKKFWIHFYLLSLSIYFFFVLLKNYLQFYPLPLFPSFYLSFVHHLTLSFLKTSYLNPLPKHLTKHFWNYQKWRRVSRDNLIHSFLVSFL